MAKPTPQNNHAFLGHHLQYEVQMLRITYAFLRHGIPAVEGDKDARQLVANVFIESFCVHARNLIEFFEGIGNCDFDPTQFAVAGYSVRKQLGPAYGKICEQISHLTTGRTESVGKIDDTFRDDVLAKLEVEVERLEQNLAPAFRLKWKVEPRQQQ